MSLLLWSMGLCLALLQSTWSDENSFQERTKQEATATADQTERSRTLGVPVELEAKTLVGMRFRLIPRGTFEMGSGETKNRPPDWPFDESKHRVTLTRDFYLGVFEVTNAQFRRFRPDHDSGSFQKRILWGKTLVHKGTSFSLNADDQPVVFVSWQDATQFCDWLSTVEKSPRGTYRLPTEAEWEYACRAGTTSDYVWGDDPNSGRGWANVFDQSASRAHKLAMPAVDWDDGFPVSAPVGKFKPNAWGIFDLHGNVAEWCQDVSADYPKGQVTDPPGPRGDIGQLKLPHVVRGGDWWFPMWCHRSAARMAVEPDYRYELLGFRVVREIEGK